ncbi:hypothetical protein [Paracoccus jiaweipingae]|uniref:hypothetical protein n=1 Tax=unclassified Paracoccus (in: a-proteobacteria) TaxID=2688777 RepID=UPI0037A2C74C
MRGLGVTVLVLTALGGCGGTPQAGDYPRLLPMEQLLAEPHMATGSADSPDTVRAELAAQRQRVQSSAERTRQATPAPTDLAARARALTARADALRGAGGDCGAAGQPPCPPSPAPAPPAAPAAQ